MNRTFKIWALSCMAVIAAYTQQQDRGSITGLVLTESGQPIADAEVEALLIGRPPGSHFRVSVMTDSQGRFAIDGLTWGSYRIVPSKEEELYPDVSSPLYDNGRRFTGKMSTENPTAFVLVVIGPKSARITAGVTDSATGAQVSHTRIRVWRWKQTSSLAENLEPSFRVLIPSDVEIGLEVSAPGYERWFYPGDPSWPQGKPLLVKSGETLPVDIKLKPLNK